MSSLLTVAALWNLGKTVLKSSEIKALWKGTAGNNGEEPTAKAWDEWTNAEKEGWSYFLCPLMASWHPEWKKKLKEAGKHKVLLSRMAVDRVVKKSDYAFLLTMLDHHLDSWKAESDADMPRERGMKKGSTKLKSTDGVKNYNRWGKLVLEAVESTQWDGWVTGGLSLYLKLDGDTEAADDVGNTAAQEEEEEEEEALMLDD